MAEPVRRGPPLPLALSFLACDDVFRDERTRRAILVSPIRHLPLTQFPSHVRLSVFAEFTGGHGRYQPRLRLRDEDEEVVWEWTAPGALEQSDPLLPHEFTFHDLVLEVPRVGRYRLELLLNGEEFARRTMWFGPAEAFR